MNQQTTATGRPEEIRIVRGARTGQMVIVCVDSTRPGPALGGCRIASYPTWRDGMTDALRLASAMTEKAALAGLPHGGGKTVVALEPGTAARFTGPLRPQLLADVADLVHDLGGRYVTGPDVGTTPDDMVEIGRGTSLALCRPRSAGGSGDSSRATADGALASIEAVRARLFPGRTLGELSFALVGLGHVGALIGEHLAAAGSRLIVSDIDPARREPARTWGATWAGVDEATEADVDVLVPAAVGGILTPASVSRLRCRAVAGPANNQLDDDSTAALLHRRGILWAPDTIVSAGGIVAATARELRQADDAEVDRLIGDIGRRLGSILDEADRRGTYPAEEVRRRSRAPEQEPDQGTPAAPVGKFRVCS